MEWLVAVAILVIVFFLMSMVGAVIAPFAEKRETVEQAKKEIAAEAARAAGEGVPTGVPIYPRPDIFATPTRYIPTTSTAEFGKTRGAFSAVRLEDGTNGWIRTAERPDATLKPR